MTYPKISSLFVGLMLFSVGTFAYATNGTLTITEDTTLTEDHTGDIVIVVHDVTLDCDDRTVTGSGSGTGIRLADRTGVTVRNCHVTRFTIGFHLLGSSDNTFEENTAIGNGGFGAVQDGTSNNVFEDNDFSSTSGI